jgi:hypothetical protein
MAHRDHGADGQAHSYFVPMVDMLAGVIFILVILLAAVSLVSRDEFPQVEAMQAEVQRIEAELAEARRMESTYLDPRRVARQALELILTRLQDRLSTQGIDSDIDPDAGSLVVRGGPFHAEGTLRLTDEASAVAAVLARAMALELPCLAANRPAIAECAAFGGARLDSATILARVAAPDDPASIDRAESRALSFLSALAGERPELLALKAVDGRRLLDYRMSSAAAGKARDGAGEAGSEAIVLSLSMNVPPIAQ